MKKQANFKVILLILCCCFQLGWSQNTVIPDPNFEQALIDQGYDTGIPDGVVPTANISSVTELYISGFQLNETINDLTGIEDFVALEYLECQQNQLTELDLSQNTNLRELSCLENQLTNLDLSQNLMLEGLDCGNNPLGNIDLSQNLTLKFLEISSCQLTTIDLSQNVALEDLWVVNNQLTTLDITNNPNLFRIQCGNNQLTELDLSQNVDLEVFYCYQNQFTGFDFSQNERLEYFYCYENQITSLDFSQNPWLRTLFCRDNLLTHLDLSNNTIFNTLNCDNNALTCLNLQNGNNMNMSDNSFTILNNPDLTCIQVDNPFWSNENWTSIDNGVLFANNCPISCSTSIVELSSPSDALFLPNPIKDVLSIELNEPHSDVSISIFNLNGQNIEDFFFENGHKIALSLGHLPLGMYIVGIQSRDFELWKKVVKK